MIKINDKLCFNLINVLKNLIQLAAGSYYNFEHKNGPNGNKDVFLSEIIEFNPNVQKNAPKLHLSNNVRMRSESVNREKRYMNAASIVESVSKKQKNTNMEG